MVMRKGMNIKGAYRDILSKNGELIMDTGWRSNVIVADYGRFLASLMKKDFHEQVGIEYIAFGGGSKDGATFKDKVASKVFDSKKPGELDIPEPDNGWVWAKKIDADEIKYLDPSGIEGTTVTNKLKIEVTVEPNEPSEKTFEFKEFALLGVDIKSDGTFATDKLFFINYKDHGVITKDKDMKLTRTITLTFPLGE
jgi:hypothetical protein